MPVIHRKRMMALLTVLLGMLTAIAPLSTDMYLPALPVMMNDFDVSPSMIQLTLTASMAGMAAGQIIAGPVSDDKGRRKPLIIGMALFAASTVGCIFSPSIYVFLLFRLVQGLSGGAGIVIARAITRDVCKGPALTRFFSMLMLVNGIAPILAPVIGGQILQFSTWKGIFVFLAFIGGILAVSSAVMPETLQVRHRASGGVLASIKGFRHLFGQAYFMGHCMMQCFAFAAFFAYIAGSSFVFQNVYGVSPQIFSLIFGINGIGLLISGAVTGRLAGTIPDWKLLRLSLWIAMAGSAGVLVCFFMQAPLFLVAAVLFVTVSTLAAMSTASFSLAMQEQGRNAGSAAALIGFFSMISGAVMAPVVGIAGSYTAIPMGLAMVAGEAGAMAVFYAAIAPKHKKEGPL
ncbi:multidrug effflux MFS transporter [Megasphaera cerevisiae]|uniref:multidrug effflux MFS transporter n=1 Tax=Megasphaera cerevisiae TaxID=39029 RepID=UPI000943F610|nr:multidrug effflux MFS transporter [Megasphaera cerevisiae]OKY52619.1 MFS transporter [Megasphaera cerevisiae]